MSEPMLPFDDVEEVRLKADTTTGVRSVRLQPDLPDAGVRSVRLQPDLPDATARAAAVDPTQNIVLEASAGTGKTGVLVTPGDPAALSGALGDLLARPDRRRDMGAAGRRRVDLLFRSKDMVRNVESVYEEALHEPAAA